MPITSLNLISVFFSCVPDRAAKALNRVPQILNSLASNCVIGHQVLRFWGLGEGKGGSSRNKLSG